MAYGPGLARIHDSDVTARFTQAIFERISALAAAHGLEGGACLDLACGTGSLALLLHGAGWQVSGIDLSGAMISLATRKAEAQAAPVTLRVGDMRDFPAEPPVELVTCVYDSLNHLLSLEDVSTVMRNVRRVLRPGGLFIFDVNRPWVLRRHWGNRENGFATSGCVVFERLRYDPATRIGHRAFQVLVPRGSTFERLEENITQRSFSAREIRTALRSAGLGPVHREGFHPWAEITPAPIKELWVAQRTS